MIVLNGIDLGRSVSTYDCVKPVTIVQQMEEAGKVDLIKVSNTQSH